MNVIVQRTYTGSPKKQAVRDTGKNNSVSYREASIRRLEIGCDHHPMPHRIVLYWDPLRDGGPILYPNFMNQLNRIEAINFTSNSERKICLSVTVCIRLMATVVSFRSLPYIIKKSPNTILLLLHKRRSWDSYLLLQSQSCQHPLRWCPR